MTREDMKFRQEQFRKETEIAKFEAFSLMCKKVADIEKENAELKSKTRWHDLKKDLEDLPKEKGMTVIIYNGERYELGDLRNDGNWYTYPDDVEVIAWHELSKFEEK